MRIPRFLAVAAACMTAVVTLAGCSTGQSTSSDDSPSATDQASASVSATPSEQPALDLAALAMNPDSVLASTGAKYWFANEARTMQCYISGEDSDPTLRCDTSLPFKTGAPESEPWCSEGDYITDTATLHAGEAQVGGCRSDVPISVVCASDNGGSDDPQCQRDWYSSTAVKVGERVVVGPLTCEATSENTFVCSVDGGASLTLTPGK